MTARVRQSGPYFSQLAAQPIHAPLARPLPRRHTIDEPPERPKPPPQLLDTSEFFRRVTL